MDMLTLFDPICIRLENGDSKFIDPAHIIYIEASAKYCNITCINKRIYRLVLPSFGQLEGQLPPKVFFPIKRGFSVSRMHISGMNKQKTRMFCREDISLVIARSYIPMIEKRWHMKPPANDEEE